MSINLLSRRLFTLAVFGQLPAAFAAGQSRDQIEMRKEGMQLIAQLQETARDIRYNAERLNSFTNTMLISGWTHYHHLTVIKSLVNEGLIPTFRRLAEIQPQLPEWKQQSIDNMLVAAKALTADVHSAILAKNDAGNVPPIINSEYKDLVTRIYQHADTLVKTTEEARTYATAKLGVAR